MEEIKRLLNYLKKDKIILIIILTLIGTILGVFIPYIISYIIDNLLTLNNKIIIFLIMLLVFYLVKVLINLISSFMVINMVEDTLYKIRKDTFNHLEKLPLTYFDKNDKGNIMSILTNDIDKINEVLSEGIISIVSCVISLIGVTIIMFYMNFILAITVILTVPLFFFIISKMSFKINDYFTKQQEKIGDLTSSSEEIISSMKTIKSLDREQEFINKFDKKNKELKDISIKANTYAFLVMPINIMINNLGNILIIGIGAFLVLENKTTVGSILAFLSYASMFREPINTLGNLFASLSEAIAGAKRIFKVMDVKEEKQTNEIIDIAKLNNKIVFSNVNFGYNNDKLILKDINLEIKKGFLTALVGETGSGKTSLINLLVKFYDIDSGNIYIDNQDINLIKREKLRDCIGMVLQDTFLFKGTVLENIMYTNPKATKKQAIEACKRVGADNFIHRLSNGYNTIIEEEGNNFSEGEKQLISIARCILKDPDIIILDEATSKVDTKTEKDVYYGMNELLKNRTAIVVAHRLSTIERANNIVVLKDGKIVEKGTHKELLNNKNYYYNLYESQFN